MIPIPMTGLTAEKRRRVEQWANLKTCVIVHIQNCAHSGNWHYHGVLALAELGESGPTGPCSPYRLPCWTVRSALERAAQQPADDIYSGCYGHNQPACMTAVTDGRQGPALHVNSSLHCNENPIYVFLFWELRGLSPNFRIHVSVSDFYIPRIGPHISCSRIGRSIVGIYKSLKDTWQWKLRLWLRNSFSGNNCFQFSILFLCSVVTSGWTDTSFDQ